MMHRPVEVDVNATGSVPTLWKKVCGMTVLTSDRLFADYRIELRDARA
jgi:hypothetical protein